MITFIGTIVLVSVFTVVWMKMFGGGE